MAIPRKPPFHGPAILSYGFRPFFLLGALYAGLAVWFWIALLSGGVDTASRFPAVDWHIHEMLFGYMAAVLAGFLMTAIPNWTGRLPVNGLPLAILVAVWMAGRMAMFLSGYLGAVPAALVDCAFLALLAAVCAREIIAGKNWRNLKVLLPVVTLLAANVWFHVEVITIGSSDASRRMALSAAIMLIAIIGGRIIPSFTRNWLVKHQPSPLPAPFDRLDIATLTLSAVALVAWTFAPAYQPSGYLLFAAAVMNILRLARWQGWRTFPDPLVLMLHLAFLWIPVGLTLAALRALAPTVGEAAAVHAFGVGAVGSMTLAVMMRATLGHTGRDLKAGWRGCLVFSAVSAAAVLRLILALGIQAEWLLHLSAACWVVAFLGFATLFGHPLLTPRRV